MTKNHNKGDHIKSDPKEENSLLHALRSARGNRADTEKRLKKELEVLLQEHVDRYLAHLDLPTKITKAVNANTSELGVDIRSATTFFNRQLEENPDFFCLVENQDLTLKFTKSWADFYNALLQRVAIKELRKSSLLVERYINSYSRRNAPIFLTWEGSGSRSDPVMTGEERTVYPHKHGKVTVYNYGNKSVDCCSIYNSNHRVHKRAYAYPVVLKLKWD